MKICVLASGGGTNFQAIIDSVNSGYLDKVEIAGLISSSKNAYAIERAKENNIPYAIVSKKLFPGEKFEEELLAQIEKIGPDYIVLAGWLVILSENFVKKFPKKIINIHPSLIPSFCGDGFYGLKVHEAALEYGVKVTGATVHFVNEVCDGGEIIIQKPAYVKEGDTPETLQRRVMEECEWKILPEALKLLSEKM